MNTRASRMALRRLGLTKRHNGRVNYWTFKVEASTAA
jgi:hypothetical protein